MPDPIDSAVAAAPFRKVYGMHRYFARRPHDLFHQLVTHYSEPGGAILDPFFGGGVTLVESAIAGRRAIGFDLNPLAGWITTMELRPLDPAMFTAAVDALRTSTGAVVSELFATSCPECSGSARVEWFEVTTVACCGGCSASFQIADAKKLGPGAWECPSCLRKTRFVVEAGAPETLSLLLASCEVCGFSGHKTPDEADQRSRTLLPETLVEAEAVGLFVPNDRIPDCNMQRESALHKKGFVEFRQLFSPRMLLAWARIREALSARPRDEQTDWLWFAFSASLRYSNRMVTRNPGWRGDKPLEWAKPGYWLPPTYLEVNPLDQFLRRAKSFHRAKADSALAPCHSAVAGTPQDVLARSADYSVQVASSTDLPLPDGSIDAVVTDPPYGSYVHYADLTNFWAVWLPEDLGPGLGRIADSTEEAVIARKPHFPGAKSSDDYRALLTRCFKECFRVLKPDRYMVLTFNNREPRAWLALLSAAVEAGFVLPADGVVFQDGIRQYAHTAQSRRNGSVYGDFVFSFLRPATPTVFDGAFSRVPTTAEVEEALVAKCRVLLEAGPMTPGELFSQLYRASQSYFAMLVSECGPDRLEQLLAVIDEVSLFDSHRRGLLERHFAHVEGLWRIRTDEVSVGA